MDDFHDQIQQDEILEPEDCIAKALYLLQLCQMDLNFGRTETIWARAKKAKELCARLEDDYHPRHKETVANVLAGLADLQPMLAVRPFSLDDEGWVQDSTGTKVLTCDDTFPPCTLYKEDMVNATDGFVCPHCGRLGERMAEVTYLQAGEIL